MGIYKRRSGLTNSYKYMGVVLVYMDTVDASQVRYDGGTHKIKLGVTFQDEDTPEYEHSVMWAFEPTLATDSQNARLDVSSFIHKKYWTKLDDVEHGLFTEEDGSEIIESAGWFDSPYNPSTIHPLVLDKLRALFGDEIVDNTINNPSDNIDSEIDMPEIPPSAEVEVFEIHLQLDGSYTEELSEDDPRVGDGHYTSHIKDAEGNIKHTSYRIQHNVVWWVTPVEGESRLEIEKCFHKTWDEGTIRGFDTEYPGEYVVEAYREEDDSPGMDTLPGDITEALSGWFGEPLARRSVAYDGEELPINAYECYECDTAFEATPRDHCIHCGSDSLIQYESMEHLKERIEERGEDEEQLLDMLMTAEITASHEEVN